MSYEVVSLRWSFRPLHLKKTLPQQMRFISSTKVTPNKTEQYLSIQALLGAMHQISHTAFFFENMVSKETCSILILGATH